MRGRLLIAIGALSAGAAFAEVDPQIHKLCSEAKDYVGCVKAMTGQTDSPTRTEQTVIKIDGGIQASGNSCPGGYAYSGGGYCRKVECRDQFNNKKELLENGWKCPKFLGMYVTGALSWGNDYMRATMSKECPDREPMIGAKNSCESKYPEPPKPAAPAKPPEPECHRALKEYRCSWSKYLEANPSVKAWAETNPSLAQKERLRLQAVD